MDLTEKLKNRLEELAREGAPREAVGLVIDGRVILLTNLAEGVTQFSVSKEELVSHLVDYPSPEEVIFWHSHPSGGVGPSRIDLTNKTPLKYHLVVTLSGNETIFTQY